MATKLEFPPAEDLDIKTAEGQQALVKLLLLDQLDVEETQITPEANLKDDLNADSLDAVELIQGLEEGLAHYGIEDAEISDEDAEELKTVGDIYAAVAKLVTAA